MSRHEALINKVEPCEQIDTTHIKLQVLMNTLHAKRVKPQHIETFLHLALMPPAIRLMFNLKVVMACLCNHEIENVLVDGLAARERMALLAVDVVTDDLEVRATAHSLMNLPSRQKFVRVFGRFFKTLRTRSNHHLNAGEKCNG